MPMSHDAGGCQVKKFAVKAVVGAQDTNPCQRQIAKGQTETRSCGTRSQLDGAFEAPLR